MFEYHTWDTAARCRQIERNNGFVDLRINKSVSSLETQRKASCLMLGLFYLVVGRVKVATNPSIHERLPRVQHWQLQDPRKTRNRLKLPGRRGRGHQAL